jgi:hypothetical protein
MPLLLLSGLLCLIVGVASMGVPSPTGAVAQERPPAPFYGVSGRQLSEHDLNLMDSAGVGTYRMLVHFRTIKPRRGGGYRWGRLDRAVRVTARRGISLLPMVYGNPGWIFTHRAAPPTRSAAARAEWRRLLIALADRYGPTGRFWLLNPLLPRRPIRAWQIWNEPNTRRFWAPAPKAGEYALLVEHSARAIRSVDPGARIIGAGIVAAPKSRGATPGPRYLAQLLRTRVIRRQLDVVGYHPYAGDVPAVRRHVVNARKVMRDHGMGRTPIWITEVGWGSVGPTRKLSIKTASGQAESLGGVMGVMRRDRRELGIGRVLWYNWRDSWDPICIWCRSAGLISADGRPKQAFATFRANARG